MDYLKYKKYDSNVNDLYIHDLMEKCNILFDEFGRIRANIEDMSHSLEVMEEYMSYADRKKVERIIEGDRRKMMEIGNEMNDVIEEVSELRLKCEHDYEEIGHDSHYEYWRCKKCGLKGRW